VEYLSKMPSGVEGRSVPQAPTPSGHTGTGEWPSPNRQPSSLAGQGPSPQDQFFPDFTTIRHVDEGLPTKGADGLTPNTPTGDHLVWRSAVVLRGERSGGLGAQFARPGHIHG